MTQEQRAVLVAVCDTLLPEIARQEDPGGLFATGAGAITIMAIADHVARSINESW